MSLTTRAYVGSVIAAGAIVMMTVAPGVSAHPFLALAFLVAMLVVSLLKLRIPLPYGQATLCMASVVDFAVLVTAGLELAMLVAAAGVLVQCTVNVRTRQPWYRTAFSIAAVALAVGSAGLVWEAMSGAAATGLPVMLPLAAAAVPYFAINSGLVATAIGLSTGASPLRCWSDSFLRTAPSCFLAAGVVGAISVAMTADAYLLLIAAAVPTAAMHLAHAQWFHRVERMLETPRAAAA